MVTDDVLVKACKASYGPVWGFVEVEMMRAALEAVAADIRNAALEEARLILFSAASEAQEDCSCGQEIAATLTAAARDIAALKTQVTP